MYSLSRPVLYSHLIKYQLIRINKIKKAGDKVLHCSFSKSSNINEKNKKYEEGSSLINLSYYSDNTNKYLLCNICHGSGKCLCYHCKGISRTWIGDADSKCPNCRYGLVLCDRCCGTGKDIMFL